MAEAYRPDLIILDVKMPKMSGYMVAAILAKDPNLKNIPIVLLTSTAQIAGNITLDVPTKYKLSKPFKPEKILQVLSQIFEEDGQAQKE